MISSMSRCEPPAPITPAGPSTTAAAPLPLLCRDCRSLSAAPATDPAGGCCPACGSQRTIAHAELTGLSIAHIDCDAFYAAVEKRDDPSLRGRPLLIGHRGGRGVVTTACYVARRFGPRSAMPMFQALQLCPQAVVLPPDMAKYRRASEQIRAIIAATTPMIEPVSLDEAYLDLAADVRLSPAPPPVALAEIARRVEREVGITISIGLSFNKFLAKLASDLDKPRGFAVIGRSEARGLLAPLPVRRIMGVGAATERRLAEFGITTIAELQAVGEATLVGWFGRFGRTLAGFAVGEDPRTVVPVRPPRSVSAETTFASDLRERAALERALAPLAERVCHRLTRSSLAGRSVVLKLKTTDFQIISRHRRLMHPTQRADVIRRAGETLLAREATGRAYRLIGIGVTDLCDARDADPLDLFSRSA